MSIDSQTTRIEIIADADAGNLQSRLDNYLVQQLKDFSRARIQKLIESGHVVIGGKPAKAGLKLKGGEIIEVLVPPPVPLEVEAEELPIEILYQDDYLAVINKPYGMVTHPGAGVHSGTLVNALLFHMGESLSGISGAVRPGIVHRLDKDTSGLLVIAKEDKAHRGLAEQIRAKSARRVYIALLEGVMTEDEGTVDKPIGRHKVKRKQMAIVENGRHAVSHYRVLKRFSKYTLVEVSLETGRTHQIRVHMASLKYPVVGDLLYNSKSTGNEESRRKLGLSGHALHAAQLSFTHPITGMLLKFEAPLPGDFQSLIDKLK